MKDNGIGIPEKHYQNVFKPFTRVHGAAEYEGILGLATCKKIVERHGMGTISCESNDGQGTTFFFTLHGA